MLAVCTECGSSSFNVHFYEDKPVSFDAIDYIECTECGANIQ